MALNDGRGAFKPVRVEQVVSTVAVGPDGLPRGVLLEVLAGDLTGDGRDEIVLSRSSETATAVWSVGPKLQIDLAEGVKGLVVQRRGAGDGIEAEVLYDERLFLHSSVVVRDLNADGVEDWVFIGGDRASGFGVSVYNLGVNVVVYALTREGSLARQLVAAD